MPIVGIYGPFKHVSWYFREVLRIVCAVFYSVCVVAANSWG